ncbi:MAG: hypothetical protein JWP11_933 [Frankiales bacterium]|nr:hypothetical protein [Frankiales bacterium]
MDERSIDCSEHGRQPVVLYTRYDPRSRPRDVPDRNVCVICARERLPLHEGNSLRIGPPDPGVRLRTAVDGLARHLERWHETNLASAVAGSLDGPAGELPRRVLALFTHGMGGLLDSPLRKRNGEVDEQATHRRDLLADDLWNVARECLDDKPDL